MHGRGELGLWDTLDAVGGWFRRLSGNAPDPEIKRTPPGSGRTAQGARLREPSQAHLSALKLRCSRLRPFQAGIPGAPVARARALACPARPSGSERGWFPKGEGGCFFPGLAPWAILRNPQGHPRPVSGPPAGMSAKFASIGMDRGGGVVLTADPLRPIRVYQETGRRCTPTVSLMGKSQSRAGKPLYARPICTTHLKVLANKEGVFQNHGKTGSVSNGA